MFKRVVAAYEALIPPGTRVAEEHVEQAEAGSSPVSARPKSGSVAALETEGSALAVEDWPVGVSAPVLLAVVDYMREEDWPGTGLCRGR